jgi:hypothetical protein
MTYSIDTDLDIEYRDNGPWRSYELQTHGDTRLELIENVTIAEVDQDGGELDCYGFDDASNEIQHKILVVIDAMLPDDSHNFGIEEA